MRSRIPLLVTGVVLGALAALTLVLRTCPPEAARAVRYGGAPGAADGREGLPVEVLEVFDGDTVRVRLADGAEEKVRLIGIDAPEAGRGGRPEIGAASATRRARQWLSGRRTRLVLDPVNAELDHRDRYGRLLAYLEDDAGSDLGLALLEAGEARLFRRFSFARRAVYAAAQERARAARLGLWSGGSGGELDGLRQAGVEPIALYPTGGDLWAVCVAGRGRVEISSGRLPALLQRVRRLLLEHDGAALGRELEAEGFRHLAACESPTRPGG